MFTNFSFIILLVGQKSSVWPKSLYNQANVSVKKLMLYINFSSLFSGVSDSAARVAKSYKGQEKS